MWIIKNRVTGEYERKGHGCKRDKVTRHAWDTLGRAKCHVVDNGFDKWYLDADFVEIDENGVGRIRALRCCLVENEDVCEYESCPYAHNGNSTWNCDVSVGKDILAYIEQLEQRVPRWISVKERLPEGEDPVLILVKETEHYGLNKDKSKVYHCQYLAYWDDEEWYTTWCNGCRKISDTANEPNADDYEVTHWMPLPELPEEEV